MKSSKRHSRVKLLRIGLPVLIAIAIGAAGTHLLFNSHADSFSTLYKFYYPGGGPSGIYYTNSASDAKYHTDSGWKTSGTYGYVNETGSGPIPVYWAHQDGRHNYFTANTATIPAGYKNQGIQFYESSSAKVPYGYCRSTASGFKLDYPCSTNPAPPPPPAPKPIPTPAPVPTPAPKTTPKPQTTPTITAADPAATPTVVSNGADGTVTVGTTNASIVVPAGNAATIHVIYGTDPATLDQATDDQDASGGNATINLDQLDANTIYSYQIVRMAADGTAANSGNAAFTTKGFSIMIHFVDQKNKGVAGIKGTLDNDKKTGGTSDKGGTMSFADLDSGDYVVSYSYKNKNYTAKFNTDDATVAVSDDTSSDQNSTPQIAVLSDTINVDKLGQEGRLGVGGGEAKRSNPAAVVFSIIGVLVLIAIIILIIRRRRRGNTNRAVVLPKAKLPVASQPDIIDKQMHTHFETNKPAAPPPPLHVGESLREMVVKSMHEEAQKKKQQQGPPPPTAKS